MYVYLYTGRVYNITPFLKFHPGGKAQLLRGAGIDCTELFDKVRVHAVHCNSTYVVLFSAYKQCM